VRAGSFRLGRRSATPHPVACIAYPEPVGRCWAKQSPRRGIAGEAPIREGSSSTEQRATGRSRCGRRGLAGPERSRYAQLQMPRETRYGALRRRRALPPYPGSSARAYRLHGDRVRTRTRYQGISKLAGSTLAECAQHYSDSRSRSRPGSSSRSVGTGVDRHLGGGGMMLQRWQPEGGFGVIADEVEDGWRRAMVLMVF